MADTLNASEWMLGEITGDGRYEPVFAGLRTTGELITAERLTLPSNAKVRENLLSRLNRENMIPAGSHILSYQGCEEQSGHHYILREYLSGDTLREFLQRYGSLPLPAVRSFARQIILGLKELQELGLQTTLLDLDHILVDGKGTVKIDAPVLDVTVTGYKLPRAVLTLPEVARGARETCGRLMCGCWES